MRKVGKLLIDVFVLCLIGGVFFILQHNGLVWLNMPSLKAYPIRGVDVSAHQGQIDWEILAKEHISFAFIKATEGSSWVDKQFASNFENAQKAGLYVGAYHFFSFDSPALTQAANFIAQVPPLMSEKLLPPVVDVEFYGSKASNPPPKEDVYREIEVLLVRLEEHYGMKPIIYTTPSFYDMYLRNQFESYPLWIRSVFFAPHSFIARVFNVHFAKDRWSFWQYNPKAVLKGYSGGERYIDLNAFNGDLEHFQSWLKENKNNARNHHIQR